MNILFICSKNHIRSLTAEQIFKKNPDLQVISAGTALDARRRVTASDLHWAEMIFVMERKHQEILLTRFPTQASDKKIVCLDIPDEYQYMDEELITILKEIVPPMIGF